MDLAIEFSKLDKIKNYEANNKKYDIKLDANESFISLPEELLNKYKNMLNEIDFQRYPDPDSEQLGRFYADYCNVSQYNIIAGNGSDELIQVIINGVLRKDEKILTLTPDFSMYRFYTSLLEGSVVELELHSNMKITAEDIIEKANAEGVKIIIFSNPNNPTGGVLSSEEILKIVRGSKALVVVDEAYYEFHGQTMVDYIDKFENLIVLRTCSKAMGLAAARLGFLIGNKDLVFKIKKGKSPFNVNALSQALGEVILSERELIHENINAIIIERDFLFNELKGIEKALGSERIFKVFPSRANFIYLQAEKAQKIFERLSEMSIAVRFFDSGNLRITVGNRRENRGFISALKGILEVEL